MEPGIMSKVSMQTHFAPVDNHNRDFRVENSFKDRQEINKELHCGSQALLFANSSSSAHRCIYIKPSPVMIYYISLT